ncbi:MAG: DNA polymerase III subunit delta [Phycisphaeraceae bacterium]
MAKKRAASKSKPALDAATRIAVLYGPDEMQKRLRLHALLTTLNEAHGEVETFTYDGKSAALSDVLDELRSFSLMQTYKLVVVDNADEFTKNHRAALERYAEEPVDHATLVLRSTTWNKGNLDKKIEKVGAVVQCKEPSPAEAQRWLANRAASAHQCTIAPDAAALLVERLGTDLTQLDTELGKLALMVEEGAAIEVSLVREAVGRSSEEQAYMMQEAVLEGLQRGSAEPMLAKLHELVDLGGQPDVLVAYFVADVVRKLNVALMMRRAGVPQGEMLKQLKIWGPRQRTFMAALQRFDPAQAARLFEQVITADARAKSGLGQTMRNVEAFCVRLADEGGRERSGRVA